jgi:hypothetical protein
MTTADHRHDTDYTDRDGDPTEFDTSRVSGSYAEGHDTPATEDERHVDETAGERSHADRLDADGASYETSGAAVADGTGHHEGGYADRRAEDDTTRDGSDQHTVDVGSDTARDHAAGDGTPAVATGGSGTAGSGSDLERLVPASRVEEYTSRWDAVKGEFVDEPRQAVAKADKLVGELLEEMDQLFRKQRSDLEHGLDADETSTEDLRLALRKYRSFFDRLLAL